jgi:catechol 2,3-dioxygenase-like lactoylglutathione lyase family enzyme
VIRGINHITLATSDVSRAVGFYMEGLGCTLRKEWPGGAYLEAGDLWLCLSLDPAARTAPHDDYSHIAFDVSQGDFEAAVARLVTAGARAWKDNRSEGASFYFLDPDGHKLELHVGSLKTRLAAMAQEDR